MMAIPTQAKKNNFRDGCFLRAAGPKHSFYRAGLRSILLVLVIVGSCAKRPEPPKFQGDFSKWIDRTSQAMCVKMQTCYGKIFRTLPSEKRKNLTATQCVKTVLQNKEEKIKRHTPEMRLLAIQCYMNILKTPCKKFAEAAFFDPSCIRLNLLADTAYKGIKPDLGRLPFEQKNKNSTK